MPKLIGHHKHDDVISYKQGLALSAADYINDCALLSEKLPDTKFLLNFCKDRYLFAVGMGAAAMRGQTMLLPPTYNQQILEQLQSTYPALYILSEENLPDTFKLPLFKFDSTVLKHRLKRRKQSTEPEFSAPEIPADHVMALVFTSGSTGKPTPHAKAWGKLCRNAQAQLTRIQEDTNFLGRKFAILGTVPPQHMYGFESSLMLALQGGHAFSAAHPFYPQDVCTELENLPRPRALVSTPFHLRMWLDSGLTLPAADLIISATAPLSPQLAASIETKFRAPVQEIYGCTETGQIATRLPTSDPVWRTYGHVEITQPVTGDDNSPSALAQGDYIATPTELNDVLEIIDKRHFKLLGRKDDLINIAGKRSSLGYLNYQLNSITGIEDGVFFMPETNNKAASEFKEVRLVAFAVASNLNKSAILKALRSRIDAVFMPRPLLMVDALPRNCTGKIPYQLLLELEQRSRTKQDLAPKS